MISNKKETLTLTKDVKNPKPDRRFKRDWRFERVWKKGTKFIVTTKTYELTDAEGVAIAPMDNVLVMKRGSYQDIRAEDIPTLMAVLRPSKRDLEDVLEGYTGTYTLEVMQQLLDNGTLTLRQVERAVAELDPDHTVLDSIVMASDEASE